MHNIQGVYTYIGVNNTYTPRIKFVGVAVKNLLLNKKKNVIFMKKYFSSIETNNILSLLKKKFIAGKHV